MTVETWIQFNFAPLTGEGDNEEEGVEEEDVSGLAKKKTNLQKPPKQKLTHEM